MHCPAASCSFVHFGDSSIRRALFWAFLLVCAVLGIWMATHDGGDQASLLLFFLYSIPCEFVVSVAPHEPAVLYVAGFHDPLTVALVAGAGTLVAEVVNYRLIGELATTTALTRVASTALVVRSTAAFARAPFAALWIAGFVPVIPFTPLRLLVLLHRYPRSRYLVASVSSRTARFYVVALIGAAFEVPLSIIAAIFIMMTLALTLPGVWRLLIASSARVTSDAP